MIFTIFPGLFHFLAPVNIIQYYDGKIICFGENGFEILDGWLQAMITVDERQSQLLRRIRGQLVAMYCQNFLLSF